jgi:hypothetical protein
VAGEKALPVILSMRQDAIVLFLHAD